MVTVKKVMGASSSCMAHLYRVARINRAWLDVTKQYEGTVSEGLPQDRNRHAYVLRPSSLPSANEGKEWCPVEKFNAADELLEDPSLNVVFKMAVKGGCAVVNENDGELKKGKQSTMATGTLKKWNAERGLTMPAARTFFCMSARYNPPAPI